MTTTALAEQSLATIALRNEPVQARSTARLAGLLDAAAAVIDELGYERLTTAMVAERAGASIGTVYRYFPDRIAVLQALATRNLERTLELVEIEIAKLVHDTWQEAVSAGFAVVVEAFRSQKGFRSVRVGDVIDLRPAPNDFTFNSVLADRMRAVVTRRFSIEDSEQLRFAFEVAVELSDAMAARAFALDPQGDSAFLEAGRDAVNTVLTPHVTVPA